MAELYAVTAPPRAFENRVVMMFPEPQRGEDRLFGELPGLQTGHSSTEDAEPTNEKGPDFQSLSQ
jgi:hypothetical protein